MSRYIEVGKAKQIVWRLRISADDYRLAVMELYEHSVEVDDADIHDSGAAAGVQRAAHDQLAEE